MDNSTNQLKNLQKLTNKTNLEIIQRFSNIIQTFLKEQSRPRLQLIRSFFIKFTIKIHRIRQVAKIVNKPKPTRLIKIKFKRFKHMEGSQILLKLISVGDEKTGKSCIIKRYCEGRFVQKYITTIGVDYGVKKVTISGNKIAVNFFDLSGSPNYQEIRNNFFVDAQVVLLVFDLQSRESFNNLSKWENVMKSNGLNTKQSVIFLLGNKNDSKTKQIDATQVIAFAKKRGYEYFPTSASTGENINEVFERAFQKAVQIIDGRKKTLQ